VKRAGYGLVIGGLICGVITFAFGWKDSDLIIVAAASLFGGTLILMISGAVRLYTGEVVLRPWDATKMAWWSFLLFVAIRQGVGLVLGTREPVLWSMLHASILAVFWSLYSTSYRRVR